MDPTGVFNDYMKNHCRYWPFNSKQLLNVLSSFCEYYICFYYMFRCSGYDMRYGFVEVIVDVLKGPIRVAKVKNLFRI